ncbi:MAG: hypothetical protein WAS33_19970 [Candidatus Promineifilaceae bacterium]|nr:hypothetical protein [Anaerolineaceae bacterium]
MDRFVQFANPKLDAPLGDLVENFLLGSKTAQEWQLVRDKAILILQKHTAELRELMSQMQTFSHQTPVETVMAAQSRMAALRWLIQSIEQEVRRLDKAYRETAQMEQLLRDQAMLPTQ